MIRMHECLNNEDDEYFWGKLIEYFKRDLFPDPEDEQREYFLGKDYEIEAMVLHWVERDRLRYFLFERDGERIGFVMTRIYDSEDRRCYLMEFCVFPEYRGGGTGRACADVFLSWAFDNGAAYVELNACTEQRRRFWHSVGFEDNGLDDYGEPSLMLPPYEPEPLTGYRTEDSQDWQLVKLVNSMRHEKGLPPLDEYQRDHMAHLLWREDYCVFVADHGGRKVGVCFMDMMKDDLPIVDMYVEPVFRDKNAVRVMTASANAYRRQLLNE